MKKSEKRIVLGTGLLFLFVIWTILIQTIDVKPVGQNGSDVGFSTLNVMYFHMTGVHMNVYTITDWLGLVPIFVCLAFGIVGLVQLIKRRSLTGVDADIIILGVYYIFVIFGYLIFEMIPLNYRPILINGIMEASYPSSTTLLVLSVMPTLKFQSDRRIVNEGVRLLISVFTYVFSIFMVTGRLMAGVHWLSDIVGSVFLSFGLFYLYQGIIFVLDGKRD